METSKSTQSFFMPSEFIFTVGTLSLGNVIARANNEVDAYGKNKVFEHRKSNFEQKFNINFEV